MGRGAAETAQIARSSDVTHRPFGAAKQIRRPGAPPPELSARQPDRWSTRRIRLNQADIARIIDL